MKHLSIDIETVGLGKAARDYVMEHTPIAYGNIKDPEKRLAKKTAVTEKLCDKLGLRWFTGRIISIAVVDIITGEPICFYGEDESDILNRFNNMFKRESVYRIYGKNISTFDMPFIVGRMMANRIIPCSFLRDRRIVEDIDTYFGFSSASNQRGKLDEYCFGLGIQGKNGMSGADVQPMYDAMILDGSGEARDSFWKKIEEYNVSDSEIVAEIVKMYKKGDLV